MGKKRIGARVHRKKSQIEESERNCERFMEDDEENGDGQVPVHSSATMEKDDADGANLVDVPVTTTTIDQDEATQEWSIPVTHLSEEEAERLAAVLVQNEDEEEEYWEYELGEKPSKANKKEKESENDAIGNGEEDEEELEDRYEYEIEQSVAEFEDEEVIRRNTIPDSSDEDEDYFDVRNRKRKRSEDKLEVGTAFWSGFEFKEAVLDYALTKGRNIEQSRWDKTKLSFKCGIRGKCKWRVYCAFDVPTQKWLVKTRYKYHSCTPNGKCKLFIDPIKILTYGSPKFSSTFIVCLNSLVTTNPMVASCFQGFSLT